MYWTILPKLAERAGQCRTIRRTLGPDIDAIVLALFFLLTLTLTLTPMSDESSDIDPRVTVAELTH